MTDIDDVPETDATEQQRILKTLWRPHPGQRAIMDHHARFRVVACGRRWGKSSMAAHLALEHALKAPDSTVWWCAPTYDQANDYGFEKMTPLLSPDILAGDPKRTKPRKIELVTGSTISFRSAEREDSLRGGGVDFLVIDEAGTIPERAWTEELRPALSDTLGDMLAIGTPRGRNWFYRWFQRGQSIDHPDVVSWQAPTYQNPHVPNEEIEDAKTDISDRIFSQEYQAEFLDSSGGVFTRLDERLFTATYDLTDYDGEGPYAHGWDLARHEDWTVGIIVDANGDVVHFDRERGLSWPQIQTRIETAHDRYEGVAAIDASRDNKLVADLEADGMDVLPVKFSPQKKQELVENLTASVEGEELSAPDLPPLRNELQVFEYDVTTAGNTRYHAPTGFHDDTVDALALAVEARTEANRSSVADLVGVWGSDRP